MTYDVAVGIVQHPRDSHGLPLPDGSWPDEPGVVRELETVRRFGNTINREHGADAWRTTTGLQAWLAAEGYGRARATRRDLQRFCDAREALFRDLSAGTLTQFPAAIADVALRAVARDGELRLSAPGANAALAAVVTELMKAAVPGNRRRLKACQRCGWLFFDVSKNSSGRWCSMRICGGREKARAYRARSRQGCAPLAVNARGG